MEENQGNEGRQKDTNQPNKNKNNKKMRALIYYLQYYIIRYFLVIYGTITTWESCVYARLGVWAIARAEGLSAVHTKFAHPKGTETWADHFQ